MVLKRLHCGDRIRGISSGKEGQERRLNARSCRKEKSVHRRLAKERESDTDIIGSSPSWVPVKTCDLVSAVDF